MLLNTRPENVQHRCWRIMLYRSQATLYQEMGKPDAARTAIAKAQNDLNAIDVQFSNHPLVVRSRDAIQELSEQTKQTAE